MMSFAMVFSRSHRPPLCAVVAAVSVLLLACASPRRSADDPLAALAERSREGDLDARLEWGLALIEGRGRNGDAALGAALVRSAAEAGSVRAETKLGFLYYTARGLPRDNTLAEYWYRRAAHAGDAEAMAGLAVVLREDVGDASRTREALMWAHLAADRGNDFAAFLVATEFDDLDDEERRDARALADSWKPDDEDRSR